MRPQQPHNDLCRRPRARAHPGRTHEDRTCWRGCRCDLRAAVPVSKRARGGGGAPFNNSAPPGGGGGGTRPRYQVTYWPLATAHSDPLWVETCFGCVPPGGGGFLHPICTPLCCGWSSCRTGREHPRDRCLDPRGEPRTTPWAAPMCSAQWPGVR